MAASMRTCHAPAFTQARPAVAVRPTRSLVISASYKNKENIDLSKAEAYRKAPNDTGSAEFQVARLTARVVQIGTHLATNKKDFAARRGLIAILSERKSLLRYLYRTDRDTYNRLITELGIRGVVTNDTRGASRVKADA